MGKTGKTAVIIGAKGAIGQAWLQQLATAGAHDHLIALGRGYDKHEDGPILYLPFDYQQEDSLAQAAEIAAQRGIIDQVIVATGILQDDHVTPEKSWRTLDAAKLAHYFHINCIGPALVAKYFLPLLPRDQRAICALLSARVGSIGDNHLGGWYGYRASKAALNQMVRTAALELARSHPQAICVSLHPGTVDSPLSRPFQRQVAAQKLFTPDHSVTSLRAVLEKLTPADSGGFFAWDGNPIPY